MTQTLMLLHLYALGFLFEIPHTVFIIIDNIPYTEYMYLFG